MTTSVQLVGATRRGRAHDVNEDVIGINGTAHWADESTAIPPIEPGLFELRLPLAAVVSDGVSGTTGARDAALTVASRASALGGVPEGEIRSAIQAIHDDLIRRAKASDVRADMGATLAGIVVSEKGQVVLFNVGDSRVYYTSQHSFVHTEDHVTALPMSDRLALSQWLGMVDAGSLDVRVDVLEPQPWRRVMLCSDGLVARMSDQQIEEIALRADARGRQTRRIADAFADLVSDGASANRDDDETIVLLDIFVS